MGLYVLTDHPLYAVTALAYAIAAMFYAASWGSSKRGIGTVATAWMATALFGNTALIVARWIEAERPPFKSLFETMVFLAFCIAVVYLAMERLYRTRLFGTFAALGSLGALAFALLKWDAEVVKLPPALQSGWFIPHVVVYFFGYAALFCATVVSVAQLIRPDLKIRVGTVLQGERSLEEVALHAIRFGFLLLTFGLLAGSVWAKAAWGDYWVWDPKENWSLVSWLVYAGYLHLRYVQGWRGKRASWVAIIGFAAVLFTYLGMGALPTADESAHVYQD